LKFSSVTLGLVGGVPNLGVDLTAVNYFRIYSSGCTAGIMAKLDGLMVFNPTALTKVNPEVIWSNPADIINGTALSGTQLNATANITGSFAYTPASGAVLEVGTNQVLSTTFTPHFLNQFCYNTATTTTAINVLPATLNVSSSTLSIAAPANSTQTFDITSNTSWTVASDQTWLTVSSPTGSTNSTITLTAEANPAAATRAATVTVAVTGVTSQTITVTQDAGTTTAIADATEKEYNIYPIPSSNIITIQGVQENTSITIFDMNGRKIVSKQLSNNQIDISNLQTGMAMI